MLGALAGQFIPFTVSQLRAEGNSTVCLWYHTITLVICNLEDRKIENKRFSLLAHLILLCHTTSYIKI